MARATRPDQVIRCFVIVIALLSGSVWRAVAAPYRGKTFTLAVPKGWTTRPGFKTAEVLVASPQNGANLTVMVSPMIPSQTLESGRNDLLIGLSHTKNFKLFGRGETVLDEQLALVLEYAYDDPGKGRVRARQLLMQRQKKAYVVTCVTKEAAWPRMWPVFKSMLASFHWTR